MYVGKPIDQGEQIGRSFASWVIVFFGKLSENDKSVPKTLGYSFSSAKVLH
jgi:hypothetical protein